MAKSLSKEQVATAVAAGEITPLMAFVYGGGKIFDNIECYNGGMVYHKSPECSKELFLEYMESAWAGDKYSDIRWRFITDNLVYLWKNRKHTDADDPPSDSDEDSDNSDDDN